MHTPRTRFSNVLIIAIPILALAVFSLLRPKHAEINPPTLRDQVHCITALDGDSLLAEGPQGRFQIRLLGVDCPEKGQEFSNNARDLSRKLCKGQVLELEYGPQRTDRYGRVLAYVWIGGRMLNEQLVLQGLALAVPHLRTERHAERLAGAEAQARESRAGFWAKGGLDMTPRRFRELQRKG